VHSSVVDLFDNRYFYCSYRHMGLIYHTSTIALSYFHLCITFYHSSTITQFFIFITALRILFYLILASIILIQPQLIRLEIFQGYCVKTTKMPTAYIIFHITVMLQIRHGV